MPRFNYVARDHSGAALTGELTAGSPADVARLLRTEGKFLVRIQEALAAPQHAAQPAIGWQRLRQDEVISFATQLAGMIDTGVPIAEALEASIDGTPPGGFRSVVEDLIQRVQEGSDFSAALAAHPKAFSPLFVHMIRASESTGLMGTMLRRVADYLTNQREIRKKIKGAMMYPCCLLVFALGATIFLLTYVIPKFAAIYAGRAATLPLPTRILMGVSNGLVNHWLGLAMGTVAAVTAVILFFRSRSGGLAADWLRLNTPVIGPMYQKACLTRALRTLGSMITAGVSVLEAVTITRDVVGNRIFGRMFAEAYTKVEHGEQLSAALQGARYMPRTTWQMLHAGERSGQLGSVMDRVADLAESDLQLSIRTVTQFIEPAMIVVMGTIIGGIALAVLLPIFQMSKVMTS